MDNTDNARCAYLKSFFLNTCGRFITAIILTILPLTVMGLKRDAENLPTIQYILIPHPESETPYLEIKLNFLGEESGKTSISIPSQWGGVNYHSQIRDLMVSSKTAKFEEEEKPDIKVIRHLPSQLLHLSYKVFPSKITSSNLAHEIILWKDLYHIPGVGIFIIPAFAEQEKNNIHFSIQWNNLPKGWTTVSGHGPGNKIQFNGNIHDLFSVYIAGKLKRHTIKINQKPLYFSLYGTFNFTDEKKLINDLDIIVTSQRKFFQDNDLSSYLVSIIQSNDPASAGGTGFKNALVMYYPKEYSVPYSPNDHLVGLSHELMHVWIGQKIHGKAEDEGLNYWWSEGFTDYHSRQLLFCTGQIAEEEFIHLNNMTLENYFLSPVINASNEEIRTGFWSSHDLQRLPYVRGFAFALLLDGLIRKNTNGQHSLVDLTHDLLKHTQRNKEPFTVSLLDTLAGKYIANGITKEINDYIEKGETIDLAVILSQLPVKIEKKAIKFHPEGHHYQEVPQFYTKSINDIQKIKTWFCDVGKGMPIHLPHKSQPS